MKLVSTYYLGYISEYIAAIFLTLKFYKILVKRYRNPLGEIDLIATKGNTLVFVEIKTIKEHSTFPAVGPTQVARIKRAAELYLSQKNIYNRCILRFDLITISHFCVIKHYKNVF